MLAITVNGQPVAGSAFVENGRAMLPLRATARALGATVWYDAARRRVIVKRSSLRLVVYPRFAGGRAYVPLRYIAQSLGAVVGYDAAAHAVRIRDAFLRTPGLAQDAPASSFTTPAPVPPPSLNDPYGSYGSNPGYDAANEFSFYTTGARAYYPGDWMHFVLIAPPGGSASMQLCNLGYRYELSNYGNGDRYEVSVPAPGGVHISNCLVSAEYTSWSGQTTWVPVPLYIGLYTRGSQPVPAATPTPAPVPVPVPTHRPEPTPQPAVTPVPVPKPVRTREPRPKPTP